ncbi:MAG: NAD(P)H-dependent flavin oxidoreductase [Turicibacter sp.]
MEIKPLIIGDFKLELPIVQGGMGIGISRSKLAAAVSKNGGLGVLSGAQIGHDEKDFENNTLEANLRAIKTHIKKAKQEAKDKIIGINLMVAMEHYEDHVRAAVEAGVDIIISGAGLPMALPGYLKGTKTMFAPIVSSARSAAVLLKSYDRKHNVAPDMIVIEGPEAGGHLGFKADEIESAILGLDKIVTDVIEVVKEYRAKYNKHIPVIVGGGVFDGKDIAHFLKLGADGVQMASRFIATEECDAHDNFKQAIIDCKKEDIIIVKSPVGMPGRAIRNEFSKNYELKREKITKCYRCLIPCNPALTPYCISKALLNAVLGNIDEALLFCGAKVDQINEMTTVEVLLKELSAQIKAC